MKRVIFLLMILLGGIVSSFSETLSFSVNNRALNFKTEELGVRVIQTDSYYSGNKEDPSIPILAHYFEIPEFTKIESVIIQANNSKSLVLDKALLKQPEQVIMSRTENINREAQVYDGKEFPKTWLFNSGSSISGSKNIGFVALYSCSYDGPSKSLQVPQDFTVEITLASAPKAKKLPDSRITRETHQQLGLTSSREFEQETYLLIYPQAFANAYQPLLNLRQKQGLIVITETVENILTIYPGEDDAARIRNFIFDKYTDVGVDFVTLGGDVEYIPARRLWAFDCDYGIENENHIPGDIYYANLNGNWNANQNELYGEDDDEVDLFPEVIVGRIPVLSQVSEVEAMVNKLIAYEEGYHPDYSQGLGLSANLWPASNSVLAQEYIEAMYYPDFINNVILNGQQNSVTMAQLNFNRNPNIIQHTGHCNWNVIALGIGAINSSFVNNMQNDYAGVMYSIGCWAAALEYNSIADMLVKVPEHGITAFVGNSRYGWGAPTADGFGFSEFYQKEFAKVLFQDEITNVAAANQLQKLPFVAYQNGDSVYKWCSYQLNTIGDSYYHLFIAEAQDFVVDSHSEGDSYRLFISNDQEPLEDVVVTIGNNNFVISDNNGIATFMAEPATIISLYKEGYKLQEILLEQLDESSIVEYQLPEVVSPNSDRIISFKVKNSSDTDFSWVLRVKEGETLLGEITGNLTPNITSDWIEIAFDQPESNILTLELYSNTTSTILDSKLIRVELAKPEIEISNFNVYPYPIVFNDYNSFSYKIKNTSAYPLDIFGVEYESDDLEIGIVLPMRITLEAEEELIMGSDFSLSEDVDIASMKINITLSNDYWQEEPKSFTYHFSVGQESMSDNFETDPTWFQEAAWQRTNFYAYQGNYSLTCSPENYGEYDLDLPLLTYTDDITLSFMYKYKMPMYGQDGFSIFVVTDDFAERIIFLGSGGALDKADRDPDDFIQSDWAEYSLNLGDLLLNKPEIGSQFTLRFSFTYLQDSSVTNDYANIAELGVFLDNMALSHSGQVVSNEQNVESLTNHISLYPNPVRDSQLSLKHQSKIGEKYEISIYNLKGQRIDSFQGIINSADKEAIQLPTFQKNRDSLASGIYFVKFKTVDTSDLIKILFLK